MFNQYSVPIFSPVELVHTFRTLYIIHFNPDPVENQFGRRIGVRATKTGSFFFASFDDQKYCQTF